MKAARFALVAGLGFMFLAGAARAQGDCFARSDATKLKYDVFQISSSPKYLPAQKDFIERSPWYPATDYAMTSIPMINRQGETSASGLTFRRHYLLWANRCINFKGLTPDLDSCRNTTRVKGNGYPGLIGHGKPLAEQLRTAFSTYAKADACTLISAHALIDGDWTAMEAKAKAVGLTLVPGDTDRTKLAAMARQVEAGNGTKTRFLVDICIPETQPMGSTGAGIVLDYEVFDGRRPESVTALFRDLAAITRSRGKTFIVVTNPLPREPNGIVASNVRDVIDVVDAFAPTITTGATPGNPDILLKEKPRTISPMDDYRRQIGVLTDSGRATLTKAQRAKIIWNISLFDTGLPEAKFFHDEIIAQGYRGLMIFRHFTKQGGSCSRAANQITSCLAFGACDGRFGGDR
jgi:hypothetical protein